MQSLTIKHTIRAVEEKIVLTEMITSNVIKGVEGSGTGGLGIGTAIGGVVMAAKCTMPIRTGHVAFREHLGKARAEKDSRLPWGKKAGELYKLKRAGLRLKVPFAHTLDNQLNILSQTSVPIAVTRTTTDDRQWSFTSTFTFGVLPEVNDKWEKIDYGVPWEELVYRYGYTFADPIERDGRIKGIFFRSLWDSMPPIDSPDSVDDAYLTEVEEGVIERSNKPLLALGLGAIGMNFEGAHHTANDVHGHSQGRAMGQFFREVINTALPETLPPSTEPSTVVQVVQFPPTPYGPAVTA